MNENKWNKKSLDDSPLLQDAKFLEKHPGIDNVAGYLNGAASTAYMSISPFPLIDEMKVYDINAYLSMVQQGDEKAVEMYKQIKRICRF